jgi:DNA-binding protein H-NS
MASLKDLLAQKEALERQIAQTQKADRENAISRVRTLMSEYGLSVSDLAGKRAPKSGVKKGNKVAPKYRNPATGDTWSGRGLQPNWLKAQLAAGRKITDFAV